MCNFFRKPSPRGTGARFQAFPPPARHFLLATSATMGRSFEARDTRKTPVSPRHLPSCPKKIQLGKILYFVTPPCVGEKPPDKDYPCTILVAIVPREPAGTPIAHLRIHRRAQARARPGRSKPPREIPTLPPCDIPGKNSATAPSPSPRRQGTELPVADPEDTTPAEPHASRRNLARRIDRSTFGHRFSSLLCPHRT